MRISKYHGRRIRRRVERESKLAPDQVDQLVGQVASRLMALLSEPSAAPKLAAPQRLEFVAEEDEELLATEELDPVSEMAVREIQQAMQDLEQRVLSLHSNLVREAVAEAFAKAS